MEVKPVLSYERRAYPSKEEAAISPRLLHRLPDRWSDAQIKRLLCSGLALQLILTTPAIARKSRGPAKAEDKLNSSDKQENDKIAGWLVDRKKPLLTVAPILQTALENDGRGSFGCVCVSPPEYLPEDEAIELIKNRLEAAGLRLSKKKAKIPGIRCPEVNQYGSWGDKKVELSLHEEKEFEFDGISTDGKVLFEYINTRDYSSWQKDVGMFSSVSGVDLADGATRFAESLSKTPTTEKQVVGLFFDPLHSRNGNFWGWIKRTGKSELYEKLSRAGKYGEIDKLRDDYEKNVLPKEEKQLGASSSERLTKQVDEFIRYLRQHCLLEKDKED